MKKERTTYEFAGLSFSPFDSIIENKANGKKLRLTSIHCRFLLTLIENSPHPVEYDKLRQEVWFDYSEMRESLKHLIQETKRNLTKLLKDNKFPHDFIEAIPKNGYGIKVPVEIYDNENIKDFPDFTTFPRLTPETINTDNFDTTVNSNIFFKVLVSLFYGILFWIGLLLEIAYKFDFYGIKAMWLGLPLVLWNSGIMFTTLSLPEKLNKNNRFVIWYGVFLLILGVMITCLSLLMFLPFEAITIARFQTQPAFPAFLKNAFIYFLPLGIFSIYIPYYLIIRKKNEKLSKYLSNLFGCLFLAFVYSLFSTFYLLDNLLPSLYHWLFVTIIFLRFIVYFGLGISCLLWAKDELDTELPSFNVFQFKTVFLGLIAVALGLLMMANQKFKTPKLTEVEIKTLPNAERQFFVNLYGDFFDSETICVRVVGKDCLEQAPCLVPNGALKKHSIITDNYLENVPLTLPKGEFQIFTQNGNSKMSTPITLIVP